jgi:hypothetical protein
MTEKKDIGMVTIGEAAKLLERSKASIWKTLERRGEECGISTELREVEKTLIVKERFVHWPSLVEVCENPRGPGGRPPKSSPETP